MIDQQTFYAVVCDSCGMNDGYWFEREVVQGIAEDSGWWVGDDGDYCPECWKIDSNGKRVVKRAKIINMNQNKPCCNVLEKLNIGWMKTEDGVKCMPFIMNKEKNTMHRVNYCPSCGTDIRLIGLKNKKQC